MKKKIFIIIGILILIIVTYLFATGEIPWTTIKVGVRTDVAGFSAYNEDANTFYGLEVDLAKELAGRLGYSIVEYVPVDVDNREAKLDDGKVDCLISCYTRTDEREEKYHLSKSYFDDSMYIVACSSTLFSSVSDLTGVRVGCVNSSAAEKALDEVLFENGVNYYIKLGYDSYDELIEDINSGAVDAAMMDGSRIADGMENDWVLLSGVSVKSEYCIVTPKNSELSEVIDDELQNIIDDGTMAKIVDKWIDEDVYEIWK